MSVPRRAADTMHSLTALCLLAFAGGICMLQMQARLPPHPWLVVATGCASLLIISACRGASARLRGMAWIFAFAVGGFGYAAWRAEVRLADALPHAWEDVDIGVLGVVDDLPVSGARGERFAFAVERVLTPKAQVPSRLSLAWFPSAAAGDDESEASAPPAVHPGERWRLTVRLKRPHGNVNPGGFDLEAWLLQQGLRATGVVRDDPRNERLTAFAGRPRDYIQRAREAVRARIVAALGDAPYAGVIVALAIGDQRAIPEAQWTVFNRTGVGHLVSISGLHVTVFAAFAGGVAFALARRSAWITSRVPARRIAAATGVAAAGTYVLLAGAEVPAVRTFAMLAVAAIGIALARPGSAGLVWLWALAAVLAWDPWAPLTPGFWLSYGAVALLLYAAVGRLQAVPDPRWRARCAAALREGAQAQWVVTLGLAPLTLALFQQMSIVAPAANAIAIPLVTLVVVPLALIGIVVPFGGLFVAAHAALVPLMSLLTRLSELPAAVWQQHAPPAWAIVAGCAGVALLLAPRAVPGRLWGWAWLLPLFLARPPPLAPGAFRLTVLDVGQGLSAIVETRHYTLVYDTGGRFTDTADAGGRIVAPFVRLLRNPRADGLIVSHQDLDHSGGALSLMRLSPIGWFASSLPATHPVVEEAQSNGAAQACVAGQAWTWDGVRFTVLHPTASEYADSYAKTNDRSCVVRVDSAHGSALLTGDIEARSESALVRTSVAALRADVIVVPHHGSRTSSTLPFIRAVSPSLAIVPAGYRNRFGHPRADILARYTMHDVRVVRTDRSGAVTVTFDASSAREPQRARDERPRYWRDTPAIEPAPAE